MDLSGHKKKKSVKIPKGYGTTISYMGHHLIKAKSSDQYKLKARAKKDKKYNDLLDKEAKENDWSMKAKLIIDLIKTKE